MIKINKQNCEWWEKNYAMAAYVVIRVIVHHQLQVNVLSPIFKHLILTLTMLNPDNNVVSNQLTS